MDRSFFFVAIASLSLARIPSAAAVADDWAVVSATNGEMPPFMQRVVAEVGQSLERHGKHVWSSAAAATRFRDRSSTTALDVTASDIEQWTEHSRAAIRYLTQGNHAVKIGGGTATLSVDARFDRVVRTDPILRLEYPRRGRGGWQLTDARQIADVLPARMLVVVSAPATDTIAVGLVSKTRSLRECGRIAVSEKGASPEALALAIRRLVEGTCGVVSASRADSSALSNAGI